MKEEKDVEECETDILAADVEEGEMSMMSLNYLFAGSKSQPQMMSSKGASMGCPFS
jgi:hypothetical protein